MPAVPSPLRPPVAPAEPALHGLGALRGLSFNHRQLGFEALQARALDAPAAQGLHDALAAEAVESFVLATCNRTEIYWRSRGPMADTRVGHACAVACAGTGGAGLDGVLRLEGHDAARHLFRVCAGLESLVQGEAEILGQVRAALEACHAAGPFLRGVVQAALRAGRMARAQTAIGVGARSVASAAVHLVASALPLGQSRVVVVGAGATGLKVATRLKALGVTGIVIANRSVARAAEVAAVVGGEAIGLDDLTHELAVAEAVVLAVHVPTPLVSVPDLQRASEARRRRPLVVADISMPPAVAPGHVAGITRVDLAAIDQFVQQQGARRAAEVPRVEALLARELGHLETWVRRFTLRPIVSGLRRKVEAIRRAELARAQRELGEPAAVDAAVLERLTRRLLDQVLAVPLASLETGALPLDDAQADYLCRLFALDAGAAS